jgi:GMP synthase-like glutamine amidotransferase
MIPPHDRSPLRIAILLNSYRSPHITEIRDSYTRSLSTVAPDAQLAFFYPAERAAGEDGSLPDPAVFDLIVVGGANTDPRNTHPWILRVHAFILDVVANHPRKKICGICWGHQTISLLFGGQVIEMDTPEVRQSRLQPPKSRITANRPLSWA